MVDFVLHLLMSFLLSGLFLIPVFGMLIMSLYMCLHYGNKLICRICLLISCLSFLVPIAFFVFCIYCYFAFDVNAFYSFFELI